MQSNMCSNHMTHNTVDKSGFLFPSNFLFSFHCVLFCCSCIFLSVRYCSIFIFADGFFFAVGLTFQDHHIIVYVLLLVCDIFCFNQAFPWPE